MRELWVSCLEGGQVRQEQRFGVEFEVLANGALQLTSDNSTSHPGNVIEVFAAGYWVRVTRVVRDGDGPENLPGGAALLASRMQRAPLR